jgi:hypothetical protein
MVQMRTRIMNQLQALAMNEGQRRKQKLWSEAGREQMEKLPLAPWASRRRKDLLELLDRMLGEMYGHPTKRQPVIGDALPSPPRKEFLTQRKSLGRISNSGLESLWRNNGLRQSWPYWT